MLSGVQRQVRTPPAAAPSQPQGQGRVAFLPFTRVVRKAGKDLRGEPKTVGDHVRQARQKRGLLQRQVAELIGVTKETVANWEKNKTEPVVAVMPAVISFLGFDPSASPDSRLGARMLAYRRQHGLSIKEAAKRAGVDPDSWSTWERTGTIPTRRGWERVEKVIQTY
jgi:transcriptional regulator with XRE-family HTH domain